MKLKWIAVLCLCVPLSGCMGMYGSFQSAVKGPRQQYAEAETVFQGIERTILDYTKLGLVVKDSKQAVIIAELLTAGRSALDTWYAALRLNQSPAAQEKAFAEIRLQLEAQLVALERTKAGVK